MATNKSGIVVLENVANIISPNMRVVFFDILAWLFLLGITDARWGVLTASNVGSPQKRSRWSLLVVVSDEILEKLKLLVPHIDAKQLKSMAGQVWNPAHQAPMREWMVDTYEKERLNQLGKAVVPKCAEVVISVLARAWATGLA